jgi:hypothetical protein
MTTARLCALVGIIAVAVIAAAGFALSRSHEQRRVAEGSKPTLLLLTSLPLVFGEDFSIEGGGSPALKALQERYRVVPISVTDERDLGKGRLLLMAHPLAQPAEDLVALDNWVRTGGRVLLLADPMLEWPSKKLLGDPLRPPAMFLDTGLLQHWGLRLEPAQQRGAAMRELGGRRVLTISPGELSGRCEISADRLVAYCSIGRGRATVVADADLLGVDHLDTAAAENLEGLLGELAKLRAE